MSPEIFISLLVALFVQFGLLWYKLGRLEAKVIDLCIKIREENHGKGSRLQGGEQGGDSPLI